MLLYTRRAPPRIPKRRSRAGCTFCKEKVGSSSVSHSPGREAHSGLLPWHQGLTQTQKKKCDEVKPSCQRCMDHGLNCAYESIRPRQRRRRPSAPCIDSSADPNCMPSGWSLPDADQSCNYDGVQWNVVARGQPVMEDMRELVTSSLESRFSDTSLFFPHGLPLESAPSSCVSGSSRGSGYAEAHKNAINHQQRQSTALVATSHQTSRHPDLAMSTPYRLSSPHLAFRPPAFSEFSDRPSRRALVDHFCSVLSHLIVFREDSGNPFQQLVLPLTQTSEPVLNAIYALSSAHLEHRGVENEEKSLYFQCQAIQGLAQSLQHREKVDRNEILAAIILLVYYEVLVQRGRSNMVDYHLKGALTIMSANPGPLDRTSIFLERAFCFYDVITALSNGTAPLSAAPATGCLMPVAPLGASKQSPLGNVDTLLGMATTLWPIIHRLSNLLPLKRDLELAIERNESPTKIVVLNTEFELNAAAIEKALEKWQPRMPSAILQEGNDLTEHDAPGRNFESLNSIPQDEDPAEAGRVHSILHNALAYRHAAFVYLYRVCCGYPRMNHRVQLHVHLALEHCVVTVSHGGPMGALLWPLFVSACDAITLGDRGMAERAFGAIERRQGMMNINRAWDIAREVWRRADLEDAWEEAHGDVMSEKRGPASETTTNPGADRVKGMCGWTGADLWRRVSKEMGVDIVFG